MSDRSKTPDNAPYEDATNPNDPSSGVHGDLPDAAPMENKPQGAQQIEIRVVDQQQNAVHFKIKATTKLDKVIRAFTERQNATQGSLRFLFEGHRIVDTDTPESVRSPRPLTSFVAKAGDN